MVKAYIMNIKKLSKLEIFEQYYQCMPLTRQKKIDAFSCKTDKMRSLAAGIVFMYGFLDFGIKKNKIEQMKFCYNEYGKPYLEDIPVQFNLSHAGDYAIAGFGNKELGIDMECIKREGKKISDRFFTEREQQYLKNIGEKKQEKQWREEFIKIWTRKESFVKAIGLGLSFGIRNIETLADENGKILIHKQYPLWNFYEYKIEDYQITICSQETEIYEKLIWIEI